MTPPRTVSSDVLLTGLVRCESCGGPMMIRTGKGGRYRYYACAGNRLKGRSQCANPIAVPEAELNGLVLTALTDRLLTPERLPRLLHEANRSRRTALADTLSRRSQLRRTHADIQGKIDKLLAAFSAGAAEFDSVRDYLRQLESQREETVRLLSTLEAEPLQIRKTLSKAQAATVAAQLKSRLLEAPAQTKRRYVQGLVSRVVVGKEQAVISGSQQALAAAISAPKMDSTEVRSFIREWRTRKDSNLRPPDS
ncbi:MAG: recombinase zinc beta ribbon domain-containing protein [Alphaproteobacteria bacterium]|nr:recombinase zinc beta ribbon domain-containing protein [Alphaproteobacteria bacterium]MBV9062957.1 recombinase zinc beta ribbon domain-containing protein [Alphaproteobacteria bacterium]